MLTDAEVREVEKAALKAASRSVASKRKVGCAIAYRYKDELRIVAGFNHVEGNPKGLCEDASGNTLPTVLHAEVHASREFNLAINYLEYIHIIVEGVYVTHPPCENCAQVLQTLWHYTDGGTPLNVVVIEDFLKFDKDKLRYDLLPALAIEDIVKVLTHGAKKYKPNNWRNVDSTDRYVAAAMRHLEAFRKGSLLDEETGLPHLAHAATNLLFILELTYPKEEKQNA